MSLCRGVGGRIVPEKVAEWYPDLKLLSHLDGSHHHIILPLLTPEVAMNTRFLLVAAGLVLCLGSTYSQRPPQSTPPGPADFNPTYTPGYPIPTDVPPTDRDEPRRHRSPPNRNPWNTYSMNWNPCAN